MSAWITSVWGVVSLVSYLVTWILIPVILLRRKTPLATLAWIWSVLLFPFIGPLFYLLVGTARVHRRSLEEREAIRDEVLPDEPETPPDWGEDLGAVLEKITHLPRTRGNALELLVDGDDFFPRLLADIESAQHHIHLEFYIWRKSGVGIEMRDALTRAARRGVEVRLIVDEIGSLTTPTRFFAPLREAGGKFSWFSTFAPLKGAFHLNLRTHRKLAVIDGHTGYVGGINIGDAYRRLESGGEGHHDLQLRVRGPSVTWLAEVFAEDWCFCDGEQLLAACYYPTQRECGDSLAQVVAGGPDNDIEEISLTLMHLINISRERLWMTTPYFVPDNTMLTALQLAGLRGVDVRLIVPRKGNHWYLDYVTRSYYNDLLPYGIRIFEYTPSLLHTKLVILDGHAGMVGSANLDIRSLRINFELGLVVGGETPLQALEEQFELYRQECEEVDPVKFRTRPLQQKLLEAAMRPLAPIL